MRFDPSLRGATVLDVRSPEEFADWHLEGAHNIPVQDLAARLDELGPRQSLIAVYCRSGRRSALALSLLRAHGFEQVVDLGGLRPEPTNQ